MRYHTFLESPTRSLLIGDSQVRNINFSNFNILSLPDGTINNVFKFLPLPGEFKIVVLFIGGKDLFTKQGTRSEKPSSQVANELSDLADVLKERVPSLFVLGIPPLLGYFDPTRSANKFIRLKKSLGFSRN